MGRDTAVGPSSPSGAAETAPPGVAGCLSRVLAEPGLFGHLLIERSHVRLRERSRPRAALGDTVHPQSLGLGWEWAPVATGASLGAELRREAVSPAREPRAIPVDGQDERRVAPPGGDSGSGSRNQTPPPTRTWSRGCFGMESGWEPPLGRPRSRRDAPTKEGPGERSAAVRCLVG